MQVESQSDHPVLEYLPLARKLARSRRRIECDTDDLVQEAMYELLRAWRQYQAEGKTIHNPIGFATSVMCRAMDMFNYFVHGNRGCIIEQHEDVGRLTIVGDEDELFLKVMVREFFSELERLHGRDIRLIAEHLALPGPEAVMIALEERAEKLVRVSPDRPRAVRGIHTVRVTHRHIREAFCISENEWARCMGIIRGFGREWFPAPVPTPSPA